MALIIPYLGTSQKLWQEKEIQLKPTQIESSIFNSQIQVSMSCTITQSAQAWVLTSAPQ